MKSFIIALILAALLTALSIFSSSRMKSASYSLLSMTDEISAALQNDDFAAAAEKTRELDRTLNRLEPFLACFGNHEEVTLIEGCIAELEVYAQDGDKTDALARSRYLSNLFVHMPENLYIRLYNVL